MAWRYRRISPNDAVRLDGWDWWVDFVHRGVVYGRRAPAGCADPARHESFREPADEWCSRVTRYMDGARRERGRRKGYGPELGGESG